MERKAMTNANHASIIGAPVFLRRVDELTNVRIGRHLVSRPDLRKIF